MARQKMDKERIPQILDAFERCILKYGVAETSLKKVAEEANITRTTINHYIGGREELIKATYKRFVDTWLEGIGRLASTDMNALFDYMMLGWKDEIGDRLEIVTELDKAISRDTETARAVSDVLNYLFQGEAVKFQQLYPSADLETCRDVGILLYSLNSGFGRISDHIRHPSEEALRKSMKYILDGFLGEATNSKTF